MKKQWHDQHLKTCTCKKCIQIPKTKKFVPPEKKNDSGTPITLTIDSTKSYALMVSNNKVVANPDVISGSCKVIYDNKIVGTVTGTADAKNTKDTILHCGEHASIFITLSPTGSAAVTADDMTLTWTPPAAPLVGPSPEKIKLLDSINPFAKALDAWQTGKASWTKGALYQRIDARFAINEGEE